MAQERPADSSDSSFPILAISIIGIIAASIVLLAYYAFVTKSCFNWHRFRIITEIPRRRRRRRSGDDLFDVRGLDEHAIQSIPNFRYRRAGQAPISFHECSVCLNEFQEEERIRMLPNCFHVFHIDCIDTWLQTHKSCPICRSEIRTASPILINEIAEQRFSDGREILAAEVRADATELGFEGRGARKKMMTCHVSSMGDECIGVRGERGDFGVQAMRRSFSLDSSKDRLLCVAVQEMLLQNSRDSEALSNGEGSSSGGSGRVRRSFFSFSHSRSSKSAVLPIQN